jgi:hypothetical protein
MARGRLISRTLGTSRKFAALHAAAGKLGEFAQTLYPLLVACSDDFGRQSGDAFTVKCAVFPSSHRREAEFQTAIQALAAVDLIQWYEADGVQVIQIVDFEPHQPGLHKRTESKFPGNSGKVPEIPGSRVRAEEKRREGNLTEEKGREEAAAPLTAQVQAATAEALVQTRRARGNVAAASGSATAVAGSVELVREAWNTRTHPPIPRCSEMTPERTKHTAARLKEKPLEAIAHAADDVGASTFCNGQNERGWVADYDWFVRPGTIVKILEGKYTDRVRGPTAMSSKTEGNAAAVARFIARGQT